MKYGLRPLEYESIYFKISESGCTTSTRYKSRYLTEKQKDPLITYIKIGIESCFESWIIQLDRENINEKEKEEILNKLTRELNKASDTFIGWNYSIRSISECARFEYDDFECDCRICREETLIPFFKNLFDVTAIHSTISLLKYTIVRQIDHPDKKIVLEKILPGYTRPLYEKIE